MDVHEVLVAARNLIDREGWIRGNLGGRGDGYCLMGAINKAHHGRVGYEAFDEAGETNWDVVAVARELDLPIRENSPFPVTGGAVTWNNTVAESKEEVLAAFDKAIAATAPAPAFDTLTVPEDHRGPSDSAPARASLSTEVAA